MLASFRHLATTHNMCEAMEGRACWELSLSCYASLRSRDLLLMLPPHTVQHTNFTTSLPSKQANRETVHDPDFRQSEKDWFSFVEKLTERLVEIDDTIPELPVKDIVSRGLHQNNIRTRSALRES